MSYNPQIISPQLRPPRTLESLTALEQEWADSGPMLYLIQREREFRRRWPDESDPSEVRAEELAALLGCHRTTETYCAWADSWPRRACADCPYTTQPPQS